MGSYFLSHLHALGGGVVGYLVPFLFVLSLVVFFHELGHFLIARWCGVRILVFSIGFGPELVGFNDRYGTRWKISAIPLGGYVKFFGDENAASRPDSAALATMNDSERAQSFFVSAGAQARGHRGGGADGEFRTGDRDFRRVFMFYGKQTMSARVDSVQPDSAAAAAGFQPGDLVVAIDGQRDRRFFRHAAHRQRKRGRNARYHGRAQWHRRSPERDPGTSRRKRTISATSIASDSRHQPFDWRRRI